MPFPNTTITSIQDEFYICPHFYCRFDNLGEPYEEIWYCPTPEHEITTMILDKARRLPSSARKKLLKPKTPS
jgi:hypothetical protein